jgi:hypothetical protein
MSDKTKQRILLTGATGYVGGQAPQRVSDGSVLTKWTGTEIARNCRVILLNENGKVLWMHDKGYGLPPLKSLMDVLKTTGSR